MMRIRKTCLALAAFAALLVTGSAMAAESAAGATGEKQTAAPEAAPRDRLTTLMMNDERAHMTALRTALDKANSEEDIERADRLRQRIDSSAAAYRKEEQAVRAGMEKLDSGQVEQLAKALSAVEEQGVNLDIDADALEQIHSSRYGTSEIERLVSAYQQTEDLSRKAADLTLQAELGGDEGLLHQAEKAHAEAMKKRQELIERGKDL